MVLTPTDPTADENALLSCACPLCVRVCACAHAHTHTCSLKVLVMQNLPLWLSLDRDAHRK